MDLRKLIREAVENAEKPFIDQFGDERPVSCSSWGDVKMPIETFASRTKSLIVNIIMEEEGISEKSFTAVDQAIREVGRFFKKSPKACELLKELESKKVRHRYAAETIYNRWHELNEFHEDDGMGHRLNEEAELRKNEVKLTDEERAEVLVNGCVWNNGSLGIWKSVDKRGNVSYHSSTPKASAVSTSLAKAIEKFPMIKATV